MFKLINNWISLQLPTCHGVVPQERRRNPPTSKLVTHHFSLVTSILIFQFSIFNFQSCGLDVEDPTPPSPPVWVQKSLPEEWPERGIDAHESGGISLEWVSNAEEDISAYHIYRAQLSTMNDSLGEFESIYRLQKEPALSQHYRDSQVLLRTYYYYKLKAEDNSGFESAYSDSISYSLLQPLSFGHLSPNGLTDSLNSDRQLTWRYWLNIEMEDYCLTVITDDHTVLLRQILFPGDYTGRTEKFSIPNSIQLVPSQIYKWRIDVQARYIQGLETSGSESQWATFVYIHD
jgi:hypothetical protein